MTIATGIGEDWFWYAALTCCGLSAVACLASVLYTKHRDKKIRQMQQERGRGR